MNKNEMQEKLLTEAANFMREDIEAISADPDLLTENGISDILVPIGLMAAYFAVCIISLLASKKESKKEAAANATSVSIEEYKEAVKLLNDHVSDIETNLNKKLKPYSESGAITIYKSNLEFMNVNKRNSFTKGDPAYLNLYIGKISYIKAAKAMKEFQSAVIDNENYKEFIKKECSKIKDIILSSFKKICSGNEFLSNNCYLTVENDGGCAYICIRTELIIRADSKLLK